MTTHPRDQGLSDDVAIIGCGAMGSALARVLAKRGHRVVAWNRTPARSAALSHDGVRALATAAEAVAAAPLVIACQTSYANVFSSLETIDSWSGRCFVNLTTGTQGEAEEMQRGIAQGGGQYLDGAVFCYPSEVGTPSAMFLYSGARSAWAEHEARLRLLGGATEFVSEQVGRANASLLGGASFFIPALGSYVESATYLHAQGLSARAARSLAELALENLKKVTREIDAAIEAGEHSDDEASLATYAEGLEVIQAEFRQVEQRSPILDAALVLLQEARSAGLGGLGISAQSLRLRP